MADSKFFAFPPPSGEEIWRRQMAPTPEEGVAESLGFVAVHQPVARRFDRQHLGTSRQFPR